MGISDRQQAVAMIAGVGLAALGTYELVKGDAATGGAMITAGLALVGGKELVGAANGAQASPPA